MMNLRTALGVLFLSLLTANVARAADPVNFSGDWWGTGEMIGKNVKKTACTKIRLKIDHQANAAPQILTVKIYDATCGLISPEWGDYPFEIRDGKVFEDGEETGSLEGNLFKSLQASGGVQHAFNMRLVSGAQPAEDVLRSYYGVKNGLGVIVIEGELKRRSTE